jgi:omega-hydroxy-beta-dihydromenaquinone-9 sulfotransferase
MKADLNLLGTVALRLNENVVVQTQAPALAHSPEMVFVTGASRSGTTMLARMLGAHSSIKAFNELHYFGELWDPYDAKKQFSAPELSELAAVLLARETSGLWGGQPTDVERAWGRRLVRDLPDDRCTPHDLFGAVVQQIAADSSKKIACEQTPRNIFYARRLLELYPNARIVHIVRDPRAVLASQKNRWRMRQLGAGHLPASEMLRNRVNYHPITMGQLWSKATEAASQLEGHSRFMLVRFEDLASEPELNTRRICNFVGVPFEKDMLDVPRWGSSNVTHSNDIKGVSNEVLNQWRGSLSKGEALLSEKITHKMLTRFGYKPEFLGKNSILSAIPSLLKYPLHVAGVIAMNPGRAFIQLAALAHSKRSGK